MSDACHCDNEGGRYRIENSLMLQAMGTLRRNCSNKRRWLSEMQVGNDLGDEFFGRVQNVEYQSVLRLFQVGELSGENGFSGEVAMPRCDVATHDFVGSTEVGDAHVEFGGE